MRFLDRLFRKSHAANWEQAPKSEKGTAAQESTTEAIKEGFEVQESKRAGAPQVSTKPAQPLGDNSSDAKLSLTDPRLERVIQSLMAHITISPESTPTVLKTGSESPLMEAAKAFGELHAVYPGTPELHYAYAAALQLAAQGETAQKVLKECAEGHPEFWLAHLFLKRNAAMFYWNPFFLPEFRAELGEKVHPVINQLVLTNVVLATRQGVLPRSVIFYRDANGELSPSALKSCKMEFLTTISDFKDPQVVAINARIHDDPSNPFQLEMTGCPFQPATHRARLRFELFVRQQDFDIAILDGIGRIKYWRRITPSTRMISVHQRLARMFDETPGKDISIQEFVSAQRRHQSIFDPRRITY